jgi:hypothetical protein
MPLTFCRNFITSALRAIMSILSFERGASGFFLTCNEAHAPYWGNGYHLALGDWRLGRITLLERKIYESLFCDPLLFRRMTGYSAFANDVNHDLLAQHNCS